MPQLLRMVESLRHESFYTTGTWVDESLGVYVGWVARKGSFSDGMPLRNERGDVVLAFSGEEFPEPGTAQRLKARGHALDLNGPSYLVHLYEDDPSFPAGLNGRFHGLLADRGRGRAMLFNDRYGMHRLYCHQAKDAFYFAAEAKAILAVRPELRADGCALGGRVRRLRRGAREPHAVRRHTGFAGSFGVDVSQRLARTASQLLRSAGVGRAGNARSRILLPGTARDFHPQPSPLFRGAGAHRDVAHRGAGHAHDPSWPQGPSPGRCPATPSAACSARIRMCRWRGGWRRLCGQPYQVITAGKEFLAQFAHYAERAVYLSDGCADVSRASDLYLNEKAREIAPVRMTGNYGGEVLRGVRAFKPVEPMTGLFGAEFLSNVHRTAETYAANRCKAIRFPLPPSAKAPWHLYGVLALEQTQLAMRSPFLDNDFVRTVFRSPASALPATKFRCG